jgi:hypothetical protein
VRFAGTRVIEIVNSDRQVTTTLKAGSSAELEDWKKALDEEVLAASTQTTVRVCVCA